MLLAQRQPKLASEAACGRQASHKPTTRKAAKPTRASLESSMPEPCFCYFLRRTLRATYTIPIPVASRARLDGSGTVMSVAPAKAAGDATQAMKSETREIGTRRLIRCILKGFG